jgi:hypothetical protein
MSKVYMWLSVFECLPQYSPVVLPEDMPEEWREDSLVENLHPEFLVKLTGAMSTGELKAYDKNTVLLSPPTAIDIDLNCYLNLTHFDSNYYLNPVEVNKWMMQNNLPYRWEPSVQFKRKTLPERVDDGELKETVLDVVKHLRGLGTPEKLITPEAVSTTIANMTAWDYEASSLFRKIKTSWWK